jgi:3'-phosphoadenosine 5'-phosphosulfate sulfotransferase (PAPS reductase)/FAD synthetase
VINLSAYKRPALQFSGGKDSLACLYLLREQLDHITVYWLDTGDTFPETRAVIDSVRGWIPHFEVIQSDVAAWRQEFGHPSDLVPAKAHALGVMYGMNDFRLVSRFDCCWHNIMAPMSRRMKADGVDAVVRGTKLADTGVVPAEGPTEEGYDVILPIRDWSHADVHQYLDSVGAPRNRLYETTRGFSAPECMGCTAWWDDSKAEYFRVVRPELLSDYQAKLRDIRSAIQSHLADLDAELGV